DEDDDDEDAAADDSGEDEDEDVEEPVAKPAPKGAARDQGSEPAPKRPSGAPPSRSTRGPGAARKQASPPAGGPSLGKSVRLSFGIVAGLGAGFAVLGRDPEPQARPKWKVGDTVDVDVTLVKEDRQDLACASADEVAGKHCGFEAANKPWTKGASTEDKVLRPY